MKTHDDPMRAESSFRLIIEGEPEEHKLNFYRGAILAATDGKLVIQSAGEITRLAGESMLLRYLTDAHDMAAVRQDARAALVSAGMAPERADLLILCAGEAMTNALKHAGGGTVSLHKASDLFTVLVSDSGCGIEAANLQDVALTRGYSTAGTLGMGYKFMIYFADHIYLETGTHGTTLGISMHIREKS